MKKMDVIEELQWRGLLHQNTPNIQLFLKKSQTAYVGFDPTAESLHIGSLAPIQMMRILKKHGHNVVGLVGGATGMIGDPSGKSKERKFLSIEDLRYNEKGIRYQLQELLGDEVEIMNNYDWFKDMSIIDFLREVGKFQTVNQMMARDSVKGRINREDESGEVQGISFTEFCYQLIQGKDFEYLYQQGVSIQMGGSDQWGNMACGIDLIRRKHGAEAESHAITCPLITKADGGKFGKTETGNVWLSADRTSPFEFYQFWINQSDQDAEKFIKIFTLLEPDHIENLIGIHNIEPHKRLLQKTLAEEITRFVHGEFGFQEALDATEILFNNAPIQTIKNLPDDKFRRVFKQVPQVRLSRKFYDEGDLVSVLSEDTQGMFLKSKGEVKRMIKNNGISINKIKVENASQLQDFELIHNHLIVQKGRKNYFLIEFI